MTTIAKWLDYLVENSAALRRYMIALLVLLVLADFLTPSHYSRFPWEGISGFGALYGFISCVLFIVVSRALGSAFLNRPEDYYDE